MSGRTAFGFAVSIAAALLVAAPAHAADNWPSRPIRIVVPYPAGGIVDIVAGSCATCRRCRSRCEFPRDIAAPVHSALPSRGRA